MWLSKNAAVMVHRRLVGMPDDLAGLCKLRVGDWRILYWIYHSEEVVRIYRIQHRSLTADIWSRPSEPDRVNLPPKRTSFRAGKKFSESSLPPSTFQHLS